LGQTPQLIVQPNFTEFGDRVSRARVVYNSTREAEPRMGRSALLSRSASIARIGPKNRQQNHDLGRIASLERSIGATRVQRF